MKQELSIIIPDKTHKDVLGKHPFFFASSAGGALLWGYTWAYNSMMKRISPDALTIEMNPEAASATYGALADPAIRALIRVRKTSKGYRIFIPSHANFPSLLDVFPDFRMHDLDDMRKSLDDVIPGILEPGPVDVDFDKSLLRGFTGIDPDLVSEEDAEDIMNGIVGFRLVGTPVSNYRQPNDNDTYAQRGALLDLWNNRRFTMFATVDLPEKAAEFITQQRGDSIRLSQLAEFFSRLHSQAFFAGRGSKEAFSPNVISVGDIAKDNAKSSVLVSPALNNEGLTITRDGDIMWLPPKSPDPDFVESIIEAGGKQADGDWCAQDSIDPEGNEYVLVNGHRQRKDRGQNRLVYVDWVMGRLSYTTADSRIRVVDITANRPASTFDIANYLRASLLERSDETEDLVGALAFVHRISAKLGVEFPPSGNFEDVYMSKQEYERLVSVFKDGGLPLTECLTTAATALASRRNPNGDEFSPAEYQALQQWYDEKSKHFGLSVISKNSIFGFYRAIATYYEAVTNKIHSDPDLAFGDLAVISSLRLIGALTVVTKYADSEKEILEKDTEERKPYLNPDLDPPDQIQLPRFPFVSGKVELMPHQAKVFNYLKNFPRKSVIGVDAGGGKTLIALLYAALLFGEKKITKALIACPGKLVSNYVNDAGWLFRGRINIVCISSSVMSSKNWGEEKMRDLIEAAPINTIFVTDYDFLSPSTRSKSIVEFVYGNTRVATSLNTQFMREFKWGLLVMDEAHFLKTVGGTRNNEMTKMASNADYLMQMSGTYVSDNLSDVVGAFGILTPKTFGSHAQFADTYLIDGPKSAPKPDAQKKIVEAMRQVSMVLNITRKEWNALLPRRTDQFFPVELSPAQSLVYMAILRETREQIDAALKENPALKSAFSKKAAKEGGENADEEEQDEEDDVDDLLDGPLNMYLARLEQFLTAPAADPFGKNLQGSDAVSPKVEKVAEIIRDHLRRKIKGKIMVWTQYVESAQSVFDNLPNDIKKKAIHYTSAHSDSVLSQFEKNPEVQILVGCEKSINTGQNLQYASRIIRLETVWNYGTLEQGESRINRPMKNDPRKEENGGNGIFYDWVFCNKSLDVTKNSRMFSKLISTVKYYHSDSPDYMGIDQPPPIKLSVNNLLTTNDWQDEDVGCASFFRSYEQYQQVQEREYKAFREDPKNAIEPYSLQDGKVLPNSGLLVNVPYVPRMQIFQADKLGLEPFLEYVVSHHTKNSLSYWDDPDWSPQDLPIHCEYGDCTAVDYNSVSVGHPQSLRVITPSGSRASVPLSACWVVTKTVVKGATIREAFAQMVGADTGKPVIPSVPKRANPLEKEELDDVGRGVNNGKRGRLPEKDPKGTKGGFEIFVGSYGNFPVIAIDAKNPVVQTNLPELEKLGFAYTVPYRTALMRTPAVLQKWLRAVKDAGIDIDPAYGKLLSKDLAAWKEHKDLFKMLQAMGKTYRPNFFRMQMKPAERGEIKPYLFVDNKNGVYLCLNQKANSALMSHLTSLEVPGVQWSSLIKNELAAFFTSKKEMETTLKHLLADFPVENSKEAMQDYLKVRVAPAAQKPLA